MCFQLNFSLQAGCSGWFNHR